MSSPIAAKASHGLCTTDSDQINTDLLSFLDYQGFSTLNLLGRLAESLQKSALSRNWLGEAAARVKRGRVERHDVRTRTR
jgi:hypothetical protein